MNNETIEEIRTEEIRAGLENISETIRETRPRWSGRVER